MLAVRQRNIEDQYYQNILNNAGALKDYHVRVSRKIAQRLLLAGDFFSHGRRLCFVSKSVGAGIYEMTAKEA